MPEIIKLALELPEERVVTVHVSVLTSLATAGTERELTEDEPVHDIDAMVLSSVETLHSFLARITLGVADKGEVRAIILRPRERKMLELLGVTAPSDPIKVRIPNG